MKIVVVFVALLVLSLGSAVPPESRGACEVQKEIDDLVRYITQPRCNKKCRVTTYDPESNVENYKDARYVKEHFYYYKNYPLPQGRIFSVFDYTHLKQAIALFNLFYYAKDVQSFLDTAYYARRHVNEGMFLYAFSVAVQHRPDTRHCTLLPIYEVYPYYFYDIETIYRAQRHKQIQGTKRGEGYKTEESYYDRYLNIHDDQDLSYFTDDIDLNRYYYDYNLRYPFWMGSEHISSEERRGELYYFVHQQLLARYYLERLSNNVGVIHTMDWTSPVEPGYRPSLQYHNGWLFPGRPDRVMIKNHRDYDYPFYSNYSRAYTYVRDYARRIRDAIDLGYVYNHKGEKVYIYDYKGFETLSHMIEGNPDTPNRHYYGYLQVYVRHLLGNARFPYDRYRSAPSALEHFETSLRDPIFYQLYKLVLTYYQEYNARLPPYTEQDLLLPGVKIQKFEVQGKLRTYFEKVYSSLKYAVYYDESECPDEHFHVGADQRRLNHDFFKYKVSLHSDKAVDAIVRVFIGPKYDEHGRRIHLDDNRMNFFEIDSYPYALKAGDNEIVRTSAELRRPNERSAWEFPRRLLLPRGKVGGQTYQIYVIINKRKYYESSTKKIYYDDTRSLGYPFDRYIDRSVFHVPNSIFEDVIIYHSHEDEEQNKTIH